MTSQALLRTLTLRAAAARTSSFRASLPTTTATRPFTASSTTRFAYKDTQDRESLNPASNEGTKTGRDTEVAHEKEAFDPSTTRPKGEKSEDSGTLDVSGANQAASKPQGDNPGGKGAGRKEGGGEGSSGAGSAPKAGEA
ncbi:hypothetical protein HER10_EVM0004095 [Colletotrichum scovillei]|uniref:Uncharacterized protein n=1 Tax=Colletotrichum scovillei TaxID=1209932 RepID=A0A9P7R313_9PEZI|nr:uncharacterized protein HER10_EVM0004095 [Colletotrichum scovillei]KAF4776172.1 hypothetical protein HER10_EVM0004095 [Colletotrichum scovillei]KAG7047578.1 hypothetical protein JMJ77_0010926 [Colletotrichum scovillei]KAG7059920.1 hypothetical protein JMJ78_0015205 [Colletotrichum scovillei]KAG7067343.1 hypothetical protein JMJ76_0008782 [Colletotrichum scovillei]